MPEPPRALHITSSRVELHLHRERRSACCGSANTGVPVLESCVLESRARGGDQSDIQVCACVTVPNPINTYYVHSATVIPCSAGWDTAAALTSKNLAKCVYLALVLCVGGCVVVAVCVWWWWWGG